MTGWTRRAGAMVTAVLVLTAAATDPPRGPQPPEQALRGFHLDAGLRLELVAAEPEIESPVAMAFDADCRLWVVEMRDYPNGPAPGKPPEGRVKILEDRDGDGRYETSRVFADGLLFANGILPWKDGAIVTAAPHIVWLRDTDGDGTCDQREVLYEGFATENPQLRVSHPVLGLDGWVYVANGLRGGQVKPGERRGSPPPSSNEWGSTPPAAKPISLAGKDFRFDPVSGRHEAISGMGQYGNTFDDWGRRFVCDNHNHLRHIVLEDRYLKRNPYLAVTEVVQDTSELEPGPLSSGIKIYPLSKNWTTSNLHAGRFTAACSVFIYRDRLLPEPYRGAAFTCDPTGNLVHAETLRPEGASFRSRPLRQGVEFLATADDWFRPVFLAHGPDEALYLVDMYRAVIEHPQFMPPELQKRPDLLLGRERGRIWRVVPEGAKPPTPRPRLHEATTEQRVAQLESSSAWARTTAQRLLLERKDRAAVAPLRQLCRTSAQPLARLHAAWLLETLSSLDTETLLALLQDPQPRVREQAVLLAERSVKENPDIQKRVVQLAADPDARVRFQVALSLGEWTDGRTLPALAAVALAGADDKWTRYAVASSVADRAGDLVAALVKRSLTEQVTTARLALLRELAALVGARQDADEVAGLLTVVDNLPGKEAARWQMEALNGLADGLGRRGGQLAAFLKTLPTAKRDVTARAARLLRQAAGVASDRSADAAERLAAVRLLAHVPWETAEPALARLLNADEPQELKLAAVRALAALPRPEVAALLLKSWRAYTPALRREAGEALLRQPDRALALLKEVEAGHVKPGDLDAVKTNRLVNHGRADVRDLARKLLRDNLPAERKQVLAQYQASLQMAGDARRGKEVFKKHCATCHRVGDVGVDVGADISDTRTKTPAQLLGDILNPNQAIDSNYINYLVTTKSGRSLSGVIAAETASSITLKRAENQTDVVLRQDVEEIVSSGVSLMPEGLEKNVTVAEMADLLAFLKNWRYLDGAVPLGKSGEQ